MLGIQPSSRPPVAVYVHTPFCPSKCGYCDFNSYAMQGEIMARTTAATIQEIKDSPQAGRPAKTIFFGGGTPTFLPVEHLTALLAAVTQTHPPIPDCEVTSEANPGTVDLEKFEAMREAGFNRLSLGAQSFQSDDLIRLGRIHSPGNVAQAVGKARQAGFQNINLDLMFALPGQSVRAWQNNLATALSLSPDHLSLYCLTIEPNTRFYRHHTRGLLDLPSEESQIQMYDLAVAETARHGLEQYEISNFSRPGRECSHNLAYWRSEEYISYGPGAVGCIDLSTGRYRYTNLKHPERYSEAVELGQALQFESETLDSAAINFEKVMMGIRLNCGLSLENIQVNRQGIDECIRRGWMWSKSDSIGLTDEGRHFCSEATLLIAPN